VEGEAKARPHPRPGSSGPLGGVEDAEVLARSQAGAAQVVPGGEAGLAAADDRNVDITHGSRWRAHD